MKIISVNVSLPKQIEWNGQTVLTSIFKVPVAGRTKVTKLNLAGDAQADLIAHGGEHRAVMVYQHESYDYWRKYLGRTDLHYGQFGENLTVEGLADNEVCIGDKYQIGTAIFEVTQPRVTCYKVAISLGLPEMPALLVAHRRPGFYFRVIQEGELGPGDLITKIADGPLRMSVSVIDALLYSKDHPQEQLKKALQIPALSQGWQYSFKELVNASVNGIASGNAGLTAVGQIPFWPGFRAFMINRSACESADVKSFVFSPIDKKPLPAFLPGQHIAVRLPAGPNGQMLIRMYSLCGPRDPGYYRIAVKREKGGIASNYLHDHLTKGNTVDLSAPRGSFCLADDLGPVWLLSAGVGITPMLAMLWDLAASSTVRQVWWIYSTQNKEHHTFAQEVKTAGAKIPGFHSVVIYSRPAAADRKGVDYDVAGHLTLEVLRQLGIAATAECYICGPPAYLKDTLSFLKGVNIPESQIRFEAFGSQILAPGSKIPHLPKENDGIGPMITFVKSSLSFRWQTRFTSLLEAAEACDVNVKWSCRSGVCHRCESNLLNGDIQYSPQPLDPAAQGNVLICCAKPVSDVQLDL